jgi:hypothetical protein
MKKTYLKPELKVHGDVEKVTQMVSQTAPKFDATFVAGTPVPTNFTS